MHQNKLLIMKFDGQSEIEKDDRQKTLKAVLHYFYRDNAKSGSHSRYSLQYHLVWIPKYRRSFLVGEIANRLKQILKEIAFDYRINIIAMEVMPDHVHMLIEAPPKYSPAKLAQLFKGISSRRMRQEFLDVIKRYIWKDGTLWAIGYYIGSVSDNATTEIVREYIKNQKSEENELQYVQGCLFN
ncbi:MAG: IS200/IS605 family transposase [Acidobacteriota bacterium]|nr:IS200/IS605 family transposase [Acidobacteriota bacterium]